jgi:hypothetical protein
LEQIAGKVMGNHGSHRLTYQSRRKVLQQPNPAGDGAARTGYDLRPCAADLQIRTALNVGQQVEVFIILVAAAFSLSKQFF